MKTIAALLAALPLLAAAQTDEPVPPPAPPAYAPPPQAAPPPAYAPPPTYAPPPQGVAPAAPSPYYARPLQSRDRWYIGFGIGGGGGSVERGGTRLSFSEYGQMVGFSDPITLSMNFKVGATLSPKLLLGLDITAVRSQWSESSVDFGAQITNYDAVATWFPMERGFFLRGGAGLSRFTWDVSGSGGSESDNAWGFNVLGGAGYAFWLGRQFNLTVNLDLSTQSYGTHNDYYGLLPESSRAWTLGVGFDWY